MPGCGYTTSTQLPGHIRSVYIPTFENETSEFLLAQQITNGITEEFLSETSLRISNSEDADAIIKGKVFGFRDEPVTFDSGGNVSTRRVRILISVEFYDQVEKKVIWKSERLEEFGDYENDTELEEDGTGRAVAKIAEDIITNAFRGW